MTGSIASNSENGRLLTKRKNHAEVINEDDPLPGKSEEGPQVRVWDVFGIGSWFNRSPDATGVSVDVEHYINEKSLRQRLTLLSLSNGKIGIRILSVYVFVLVIGCLLYLGEALTYDYGGERTNFDPNKTLSGVDQILELVLVEKTHSLWGLQLIIAFLCLCYVIAALIYASSSCATVVKTLLNFTVLINFVIGTLFLITILYPTTLKDLYIPSFLLCWPARDAITTATIQLVQRQALRAPNTFRAKVVSLFIFLICFSFTWVCLLHHFMRIDLRLSLFDTYWFVMVTITTVGYGDIAPSHWTTKLLVTIFIVAGVAILIPQVEELYAAFVLQQRLNNSIDYTKSLKHIIVCSTHMKPLVLRDFLTEFFSDPWHYDVHVVVLVENDLPSNLKLYLSHPVWKRRITVLIGTPLHQADLARASAQTAIACFLHTTRNQADPDTADQHTIMSAWAIRDYAPQCKLYVQILRPKNKIFLENADHVVCEGELKNALLAASSHCPGISALVTLLLHTFKPEECGFSSEDYKLYNKCAPCEVYDSRLGDSKYFHHFVGKNFLYAAVVAYRKYQVTLLGVRSQHDGDLQLNPDLQHILEDDDICYYIGFAREEYSKVGGVSAVHTALWNACANIGLFSLNIAGIDFNKAETSDSVRSENETGSAANSPNEKLKFSLPEPKTRSPMDAPPSTLFPAAGERHHVNRDDRHNPARRGLQLLRFHSRMDLHANPIVKVTLPMREPDVCPEEEEEESTCPISPDAQHLTFDLVKIEEGRRARDKEGDQRAGLGLPLQPTSNDPKAEERNQRTERSPNLKRLPLYSSGLSLVSTPSSSLHELPQSPGNDLRSPQPPFISTNRRSRSHFSERPREEVVLELEDIAEEEELEGLEGGRVPAEEVGEVPRGEEEEPPRPPEEPELKYDRGPPPSFPYLGFEHCDCHLLPTKRPHSELRLNKGTDEVDEEELACHWPQGAVIVSCSEVWEDLYHFVTPLRACNLPPSRLKPLVLLLEKEPSTDFLKFIAPLPMVYYCLGSLLCVDSWLRAGILRADSVVVLSKPTVHLPDQHEHMVDAESIMAVQQLAKLFPQLHILTEIHYRYNIRFMKFTACETYTMRNFTALSRRGDHLTYLFMPQFAAGRAFCSSMLDTLLYQAHTKPYIIDLLRQLLGCKQVPGSGFLGTEEMTEELLKLQTYGRLFQRLASTKQLVPLGIYRTVPVASCPEISQYNSRAAGYDPKSSIKFLNSRLNNLGLKEETPLHRGSQYQSFVLPNPPQKTQLQARDIILVLKPATSNSQAQASPTPIRTDPESPLTSNRAPASDGPERASPEPRVAADSPLARQSPTPQERQCPQTEAGDSLRRDARQDTGSTQGSRHSLKGDPFPQLQVAQQGSQSHASDGMEHSSIGMGRGGLTVPVECHVSADD